MSDDEIRAREHDRADPDFVFEIDEMAHYRHASNRCCTSQDAPCRHCGGFVHRQGVYGGLSYRCEDCDRTDVPLSRSPRPRMVPVPYPFDSESHIDEARRVVLGRSRLRDDTAVAPALNDEEWRTRINDRDCRDMPLMAQIASAESEVKSIAILNDALPDDSPYKITHDDVEKILLSGDVGLRPIAAKLAALLPPET